MKIDPWISAEQACEILGVKRQTLYAYVSRGHLETKANEYDPRRSLYSGLDVSELAKRNRRPRARAAVASQAISWGDPVLESSITTVKNGQLYFADQLAVKCAETYSLETICNHHFGVRDIDVPLLASKPPRRATAKARAYRFLSDLTTDGLYSAGRSRNALAVEAQQILSGFADAMIGASLPGLIHERLAAHWALTPKAKELIRAALVLISDHELNASTFAVRVCASTGAPLPACLLAGLSTLDGPLHGEAATQALAYMKNARHGKNVKPSITKHTRPDGGLAGFGHPLYPAGDPRAVFLLSRLPSKTRIKSVITSTVESIGHLPSVDLAFAAMAIEYNLPDDAPFMIFAIGRAAGWLAHAAEQVQTNRLIRPRARFIPRVA